MIILEEVILLLTIFALCTLIFVLFYNFTNNIYYIDNQLLNAINYVLNKPGQTILIKGYLKNSVKCNENKLHVGSRVIEYSTNIKIICKKIKPGYHILTITSKLIKNIQIIEINVIK